MRWMLLTLALTLPALTYAAVPVVADGAAAAVIVLPAEPLDVESYAAAELAEHVALATGATLPIVAEDAIPAQPAQRIYLGNTAAARAAGVSAAGLERDAFRLRSGDGALFVVGVDEPGPALTPTTGAGTLFGVYELLERHLGVRWLWPGDLGRVVPRAGELTLPDMDETVTPAIYQRHVRSGLNLRGEEGQGFTPAGRSAYARAQNAYLRRHRLNRAPLKYGHAFESWWETYGEEHPDWFQLLPDGRRGPTSPRGRTSMCVSNPELHQKIIDEWLKARAADPAAVPTLNVCENDIHGLCTCERCLAWDGPQPELIHERFGPHVVSDRYARFWQTIQQMAAEHDPDVKVMSYAYVNYYPAPTTDIELSPNNWIGLVPDIFFPRSAAEQDWVKAQWEGWADTGARLLLRPNYILGGYAMPHIYSHQYADEFQHAASHGMLGTDFDSLTGQWATQGPTLYLVMRLHTEPGADVEALLDEYYQAFGPAADAVRGYFDYWEQYITDHTEMIRPFGWFSRYPQLVHQLFPPEVLAEGEARLAAAARAAAGDATATQRVAFLAAGLEHAKLAAEVTRSLNTGTPPATRRALQRLLDYRREHESDFIANYDFLAYLEKRNWQIPEGYSGEPVRPLAEQPAAMEGQPAIPVRGSGVFMALLDAGEPLRAVIGHQRVGAAEEPVHWSVFGPGDDELARGEVGPGEPQAIEVAARTAGPHLLITNSGKAVGQVHLASPHAVLTGRRLGLLGPSPRLWFYVPAGVERFEVILESQAPGETARMTLYDPAGEAVGSVATGGETTRLPVEVQPTAAQTGRAWSLEVTKADTGVLEDYNLTLGEGLPAYWALAADRLVVPE